MIHFVVIEQKNQQETLSRSFPKIKRILRTSLSLFSHEGSSAFQLDTLYTIWPTEMDT